jgi:hypothetical protein
MAAGREDAGEALERKDAAALRMAIIYDGRL